MEHSNGLRRLMALPADDWYRFRKRCAEVTDWPGVVDMAVRHGVTSILHERLVACGAPAPRTAYDEIRRRAIAQRLAQSANRDVLHEILTAMERAGVAPIALKGPILGERLYGSPVLRVSWDLDLMIGRDSVSAALGVLERLGYAQRRGACGPDSVRHHIELCRDDSPNVELHFRLLTAFGAILPADEFLIRGQAYRTKQGAACLVLSPEDELLHLVLHAAVHLFARMAWLVDIKRFIEISPSLDWTAVADRARHHGVLTAYAFAIGAITRCMELEIPEGAFVPTLSHARSYVARALLQGAERSTLRAGKKLRAHLFRAAISARPRAAARYLWGHGRRAAMASLVR